MSRVRVRVTGRRKCEESGLARRQAASSEKAEQAWLFQFQGHHLINHHVSPARIIIIMLLSRLFRVPTTCPADIKPPDKPNYIYFISQTSPKYIKICAQQRRLYKPHPSTHHQCWLKASSATNNKRRMDGRNKSRGKQEKI